MELFHVEFDATGFTQDPTVADGTLSAGFIEAFNARHARAKTFPVGVVSLVRGQVSSEPTSSRRAESRHFVSIVLALQASNTDAAERYYPPQAFLNPLFEVLGKNRANQPALHLDRGWEIVAIDKALELQLEAA